MQACNPSSQEYREFKVKFRCTSYSSPGWAALDTLPQNKRGRGRDRDTQREGDRYIE